MAYSGYYVVKNPKKYKGDHKNVVYRSLWELQVFKWCDANPKVKGWSSEEIVIPYYYDADKRYHKYFPDVKMVMEDKTLLIEIKPENQTLLEKAKSKQNQGQLIVNRAKWKNAQLWCKNKGFRFRIINEKDIFHGAR